MDMYTPFCFIHWILSIEQKLKDISDSIDCLQVSDYLLNTFTPKMPLKYVRELCGVSGGGAAARRPSSDLEIKNEPTRRRGRGGRPPPAAPRVEDTALKENRIWMLLKPIVTLTKKQP